MMREILRLWNDRRGAIAPMTAIVLTMIISFAALAIDMAYNYYIRNKLQVTADASALAGAQELDALIEGDDQGPMIAEANYYAEQNMPAARHGDVLVPGADVLVAGDLAAGNWDSATRTFTIGGTPYNAVQAITRRQEGGSSDNPVPAFLGGIFGFSSYDIVTSAIAIQTLGGPTYPAGCIMATSSDADPALRIQGTATINSPSCSILVASDAACAISANGTPTVTTVEGGGTYTAGGYCASGAVSWNPAPVTDSPLSDFNDPYDDADPCDGWELCEGARDNDQCDYTNATFQDSQRIQPGVYCGGIIWTGSGTAEFEEGEYIIKDGPLDIGGNITIDGDAGVGFYLMGSGSVVNLKGESDVALIAPSSGPMQGFVFYEEEKDPNETHNMRGTNGGGYDGVLYFDGEVNVVGTAGSGLDPSFISDCTVLIANTVRFTGTSGLDADASCSGDGATLPPGELEVVYRLVE